MIAIRLTEQSGIIRSLLIQGHAQAGAYGEDLVCAGVSAIAIGLCNALDQLHGHASIQIEKHCIAIQDIGDDGHTQDILHTALIQLQGMEERFPQNVNIKKTED